MTRPSTRILWGLIGVCLFASIAISFSHIYGVPSWVPAIDLRRAEIIVDLIAVLFWIIVFGIYWANKK